jgi:hypothetical protein
MKRDRRKKLGNKNELEKLLRQEKKMQPLSLSLALSLTPPPPGLSMRADWAI